MSRPFALFLGLANLAPVLVVWLFLAGAMGEIPWAKLQTMTMWSVVYWSILSLVSVSIAIRAPNRKMLNRVLWAVPVVNFSIIVFPAFWSLFMWRRS